MGWNNLMDFQKPKVRRKAWSCLQVKNQDAHIQKPQVVQSAPQLLRPEKTLRYPDS